MYHLDLVFVIRNITKVQLIIEDCGTPDSTTNGYFNTINGTTFGSSALYLCNDGFLLVGSSSRSCQTENNTVQWSPEAPMCILQGTLIGRILTCFHYVAILI